ncbi:MAG: TerB family tellurite resistance protein [Rhizobiaceae bacterium]|jgi:uncharacterized tellurite resistance protein B-like protein|nr:TerB family tellurite resistance protein [Rhizobiaceae bacterium]
MIDRLRAFLAGLSRRPDEHQADNDLRLAAAAILIHLADADGTRDARETRRLHDVIAEAYGLTEAETQALVARGAVADSESVDFYRFTRTLNRALDRQAKQDFIAMMWDIAFADRHLDEIEDALIWRIAELIGIDQAERIALKQQVAARREAGR